MSFSDEANPKQSGSKSEAELSTEEKQRANELKKRDAEVKAREQAPEISKERQINLFV